MKWFVMLMMLATMARAQDTEVTRHLEKAEQHWTQFNVSSAMTEWRAALKLQPDNAVARKALTNLEPAFERTDEYLALVETLVKQGHFQEAGRALREWSNPFATREQRARMLLIKGRVAAEVDQQPAKALTAFRAALATAKTDRIRWAARLELARHAPSQERAGLLRELIADSKDAAITTAAAWHLIQSERLLRLDEIAALRTFLNKHGASRFTAGAQARLGNLLTAEHGRPTQPALEAHLAALDSARRHREKERTLTTIARAITRMDDVKLLKWLSVELRKRPADLNVSRPPSEVAGLAHGRVAAIDRGPAALRAARTLQEIAAQLVSNAPSDRRLVHWQTMEARAHLMEGQLLLMAGKEPEALPALARASEKYRALLTKGEAAAGRALVQIGSILETRGRPDGAAHHYRLVSRAFATHKIGATALWRLARVYRDRLDQPLKAIAVLQEYHDLYPPSFRVPSGAQERIRALGYPDAAAFQAAHGLKVDGVLGSQSLTALAEEEANFREILPKRPTAGGISGNHVHQVIYDIAKTLESRGHYRDAIRAYQVFLGMYPGHNLADDALYRVARLFRKADLFNEAVFAYERMMEDYPNGDMTSHAYLEAAYCHECLGRWERAEELYDLFVRKFPHYKRSNDAKQNLVAIRRLIRYTTLVQEDNLTNAKMADATYEIGRILYRKMKNRQKAADVFTSVADRFPSSYQGPDARFSAGVCLLHENNFDDARAAFRKLLRTHADSRLADDAQYWIGHTYEYQARSLGELDYFRIRTETRSGKEVGLLRKDLVLRRAFWPEANVPANGWHKPHPDLLKQGRTRDKVRDDLQRAITAYRAVVEKHAMGDMAQTALLRIGAIYTDYLKDPDKAIDAYRELLEKYPGSKAAVDAQFTVGQHYLERNKLANAEKAITLFLSSFPNHAKAADAKLNLAECHRRQKQWLKALDDYQSFLTRHPGHAKAVKVREEVEWLKKYRF